MAKRKMPWKDQGRNFKDFRQNNSLVEEPKHMNAKIEEDDISVDPKPQMDAAVLPEEIITSVEKPEADDPKEELYLIVSGCKALNLREKPDKDAKVLKVLPLGERLITNAFPSEEWAHVWLPDKEKISGYVMRRFTEEVKDG